MQGQFQLHHPTPSLPGMPGHPTPIPPSHHLPVSSSASLLALSQAAFANSQSLHSSAQGSFKLKEEGMTDDGKMWTTNY